MPKFDRSSIALLLPDQFTTIVAVADVVMHMVEHRDRETFPPVSP